MKVHGAHWLLVKLKGESVDGLVYMYRPPNKKNIFFQGTFFWSEILGVQN